MASRRSGEGLEAGGWRLEAGGWRLEGLKLEAGGWRLETEKGDELPIELVAFARFPGCLPRRIAPDRASHRLGA